jgi:activator of 2-hydroxyglutaryl-CoA dehydratase
MDKETTESGSDRRHFFLGLDIGSVSLNTVVMDKDLNIIEDFYDYIQGRPFNVLKNRLNSLLLNHPAEFLKGIAVTGSGGNLATELIGGTYVNEIIAQATSSGRLFPLARTVIEIGGEDSKLILLEKDPSNGHSRLVDFEMNSICAAGTGSFSRQGA